MLPALDKERVALARKVRALRTARQWTQAELAVRLGLSQSRLSEIERGDGSFTAEQFLEILRLFNVTPNDFVPIDDAGDQALQNALARLGARHLRESSEVLPSERLREVDSLLREVLISAESPRLVTALAPVLVQNLEHLKLTKLQARLAEAGLDARLSWLVENTLEAIRQDAATADKASKRLYRRAEVVLGAYLARAQGAWQTNNASHAVDVLDPSIRSKKTLDDVLEGASPISRRWSIATSIQPEDFTEALRGAHV
jgi:transcriptional regulator with XRE-family HTH domain